MLKLLTLKTCKEMKRITPEIISELSDNEVFVFGSNLSGIHGAGAAKLALNRFGAIWGLGSGIQGKSYAIPTKDFNVYSKLSIDKIKDYVDIFIIFAKDLNDVTFFVTEIGCGLAGYIPEDIAPLFVDAMDVENIYLPERFWKILK